MTTYFGVGKVSAGTSVQQDDTWIEGRSGDSLSAPRVGVTGPANGNLRLWAVSRARDRRNIVRLFCLLLFVAVVFCQFMAAWAAPIATNLAFEQTNFLDSHGVVAEANSLWGALSFSYDPDPTTTYYLNVTLANSTKGPTSWAVQNLPLPYIDNGDNSTRRETVDINLAELGLDVGDDWTNTYYAVTIDQVVQNSAPTDAVTSASVSDYDCALWSASTEVVAAGFSGGTPLGIVNTSPTGPRLHARHDLRHVDEGDSKCMAGAFARSLDWLNRHHNLGLPNIGPIYLGLINEGVSDPGWLQFYWNAHGDYIEAKQSYLAKSSLGTKIRTKIIDLDDAVRATPNITQQAGGDLWAWLKAEWEHGEDIELSYAFYDDAGNVVGRHIGAVEDISFDDNGIPDILRLRDDDVQDELSNGRVRAGKLIRNWEDGKYVYYWGSYQRKIEFAISESVIPEPSTLILAVCALVFVGCRRRVSAF